MRTPLRARSLLAALLVLPLLLAACGGSDDDERRDLGSELADRFLRLGEDLRTEVEVFEGALPPTLAVALNPGRAVGGLALPTTVQARIASIDVSSLSADTTYTLTKVDEDTLSISDGATTVNLDNTEGTIGTDGEITFTFTGAIRATVRIVGTSAKTVDDIFTDLSTKTVATVAGPAIAGPSGEAVEGEPDVIEDLVAIPVHPAGELLGSYRLRRLDGIDSFFLFYDVPEGDRAVEVALRQHLDQTPWQVVGGQSGESISTVRFRSTLSGDIDGQAAITPLPPRETEDGGSTAVSNIIYIVQVQPVDAPEPPPFVLPPSREPPADFPLPFLLDGMEVLTVAWGTQPGATIYQVTLLSPESAFDVAARYRDDFVAAGWQLDDDRAVGFATVLAFSLDEGASVAQLTIDAFDQDDSFTAVQLRLQDGG